MKYFKLLLLVMVFPLLSGASAHKFYVSITKIDFVEKQGSLQITLKIFTDDIEDALQANYNPSLILKRKNEAPAVDASLENYLLQKLKIVVNDREVKLNYLGKEYETDMLVAYIEVAGIKELNTVTVENKILMEIFSDQQNIIHVKTPSIRRSLILDRDEPGGKLIFN
ncbi:MAG: hypothetical protein CL526_01585 [Aequorivita sp.]|nr:hypothetical protein [Aequorivita sp.]|tara:strand:+ start:8607 stop:9110 length:504 start_codon:yes stop_codon:yes gene_type:complete